MRRIIYLSCLLLAALLAGVALAGEVSPQAGELRPQAGEPLLDAQRWRMFNDPEQFPSLYVSDMAQTISGTMWLATEQGLLEHFGTYCVRREPPELPRDVRYNCLLYAVDGTMWVGTSAGVVRYVGREWRYPIRSGNITALTESADGAIWIGVSPPEPGAPVAETGLQPGPMYMGLLRYKQGKWQQYGTRDGLPDRPIRTLYGDQEGGVWTVFGTGRRTDAVYRFFGDRWSDMVAAIRPPPGDILTIAETNDGAYWFGTYGRGVWRWKDGAWDTFGGSDIATFTAASLLPMPDGSLWAAGSPAGTLYRYSRGTWESYPIRQVGIAGPMITRMLYALDDSYWFIISGSGVARFDRRGGPWWVYDQEEGLPSDASVEHIARGPGTSLWIGTTTGLFEFENDRFVAPPVAPHVSDEEVTAVLAWPDGTVWVASGSPLSIPGIWRYDGRTWMQLLTTPILDQTAAIRAMLRARDGDVWVGTMTRDGTDGYGVFRLHNGAWRQFTTRDGLPDNRVLSLTEDAEGRTWVGTASGVARFDGQGWRSFTANDGLATTYPWTMCGTRDSSVWVGGNLPSAGVSRWRHGTWTHYTADAGLASNDVWSIVEAEDGSVWFGTTRGVSRFDGERWLTFRSTSGLAKDQVWGSAVGADGSLWFGHFDGVITRYHATSTDPPRTFLEQLPQRVAYPGFLTVRWWGRDMWDRTPPEDLLYSWRLDDGAWSSFAKATSHVFDRLPRGRHTFEVVALDQERNVDVVGARAMFSVQPPFWNTWWFLLPTAIGAAGIAIAGSIAVQRSHRLRQAQSQLVGELQRELQVAQQLQADLLPQRDPVVPGLEITGRCRPASRVGGDYFTYLWADGASPRVGIVVADVTGHAMQAAIPAVLFSGMLTTAARQSHSPAEILRILNESLQMRTGTHTFICCTIAVFDVAAGVLRLANAGGLDPLRRVRGRVDALEVEGDRLPLGMVSRVQYVERVMPVSAGDTFVFLTDGIVEAKSPEGELFGFERVLRAFAENDGVADTRERLLEDAARHMGDREAEDDITLLVVRVGERVDQDGLAHVSRAVAGTRVSGT